MYVYIYRHVVVATDQDTGIAITVCFTLAGSSDDFIVHLKQNDTDIIYQDHNNTVKASEVTQRKC